MSYREEIRRLRTRVEQVSEEGIAEGSRFAATQLFEVVDGCDRALAAIGPEHDQVRQGLELVLRSALSGFERIGITCEYPLHEQVDPQYHQVLSLSEAPGVPGGEVVLVVKRGWRLDDRLLQAAQVIVARGDGSFPVAPPAPVVEPVRRPRPAREGPRRARGRSRVDPGWSWS